METPREYRVKGLGMAWGTWEAAEAALTALRADGGNGRIVGRDVAAKRAVSQYAPEPGAEYLTRDEKGGRKGVDMAPEYAGGDR